MKTIFDIFIVVLCGINSSYTCSFIGWFMLASDTQVSNGTVENTLAKMKEGEFVSRPGWEDVYTSMAKPKSDSKVTPVSFVH